MNKNISKQTQRISKSVTYDRDTNKIYNNIYPDRPFTSGLTIPKSLAVEEPRPSKQRRTKTHRKKRMKNLADYKAQFKKITRVDKQRTNWEEIEKRGGVVPKWKRTSLHFRRRNEKSQR